MAKSAFAKKAEASIKERTLVDVRRFQASRERVFDAWTDEAQIAQWMGPEGFTVPSVEADLRVGGTYKITMRSPAGSTHMVAGTYCEIKRGSRLVFTWAWQDGTAQGPVTCVTLELKAAGKGSELRVHHALFEDRAGRDSHRGGWTQALDKLGRYVKRKGQASR
ncbi:MAG TPA: SRPBCC domain-containing protein [Aestuariivirgaceae bacterium]|nr:SRPBCC domain-containing protein [Aestuariivirgaceae bacterium]